MEIETIKGLKRTHYCGDVEQIGSTVVVGGFVQKVRDMGALIFIDLRDRSGIVQLAFDENTDKSVFEKASNCHSEYVVMAKGVVRERESKTRLKYRYLDLRRKTLQDKIIMRSKIAKSARDYFYENGFIEIETPMLIRSTPEGARDYLVPSRIHSGKFYALPQSPQIYKQLLMVAGFDTLLQR